MRRIITLTFALLLGAPLAASCATSGHVGADTTTGAAFAPFRAQDIAGQDVDLARHVGKDVVLVSFWATYCEPCKAEMPFLQSYHERYQKDGLTIVSVSLDGPDTAAEVAPYIRKQGYSFPVVVDEDGAIAQSLNPSSTAPYALLVGRDGQVKKRITGFQPSEAGELERELKSMLGLPL